MDNFTPRLRIQLALTEAEAHGLRDILDWLDINEPADFTDDQRNGLERLLESLGRDQIRRYFALGPNESAVEHLLRRSRRAFPIPLIENTGVREAEIVNLRRKDVTGE